MARKVGLTLDDVVDAATTIADTHGLDAVSPTRVAAALGVRPPSLYAHVAGVAGLRRALARRSVAVLTESLRAALAGAAADRSGLEPVVTVGHAYRRFVHEHPGLAAAQLPAPDPARDPELAAEFARPVALLAGALGVAGDDAVHVIRTVRAAVHGFCDLERQGGFGLPVDLDESFDRLLETLVRGRRG